MRSESSASPESSDAATTNLPAHEMRGMYLMGRQGNQSVVCVQGAGRVLAVTPTRGLFTSAMVETTVGFYAVSGGIGLSKAEELILQTRANRRRYLCDASQRCLPLL